MTVIRLTMMEGGLRCIVVDLPPATLTVVLEEYLYSADVDRVEILTLPESNCFTTYEGGPVK